SNASIFVADFPLDPGHSGQSRLQFRRLSEHVLPELVALRPPIACPIQTCLCRSSLKQVDPALRVVGTVLQQLVTQVARQAEPTFRVVELLQRRLENSHSMVGRGQGLLESGQRWVGARRLPEELHRAEMLGQLLL